MESKINYKSKSTPKKENFAVGAFKGEVRKVNALWNRIIREPMNFSRQADTVVVKRVCSPIPSNQAQLAAEARGEKLEREYFQSTYNVRVL